LVAALLRIIARRPVLAFMVIGLGAYFLTVAIPPIVNAQVLPFDLPLHGVLEGLLASVSVPYWLPERSRDTTTLFDLARRSVRWRVPTRGIVLSIHEERGSGGAPRAHVELGRHCCARTSGVVSDFTSDTAISPMSAAILAGRLGFTSGRTSRSMISSKPSADPMSVVVYARFSLASAWLSPSFTSEDDCYVDDGDRCQRKQHDYEADRRIDQVQPDREGCADDQTNHGKPYPQGKSAGGWRCAADPCRGVVVARQPPVIPALSVGSLAPSLIGDHSLKIPGWFGEASARH
jgi:hypothetical protein